jgi:hypothetical protein
MRRHFIVPTMLGVAAMLGFPAWPRAASLPDGVIEINQAALKVAKEHYTISTPGSYQLTDDLSVSAAAGVAITVAVDGVTINLNGFRIIGPGAASTGSGIQAIDGLVTPGNLHVENGSVAGFNFGIIAGNNSVVRNVHADNNTNGITVGSNSIVEGSTANGSAGVGITCDGSSCVISGNTAHGPAASAGIVCDSGACVIAGNATQPSSSQGAFGIRCDAGQCAISNNVTSSISGGTSLGNNICTGGTAC